ncbi:DNA replication terminus site-binding protein [Oceanobacter mangrovi]|uniref:DNA replication terminus site-binding protein n=1 Tax=Oceanobacter mangrovi TaxID=2862510 RepID=UPI001C8DF8EC|nr:DNA replication terminus site-binding protein [Oceanobacter mangrovi]
MITELVSRFQQLQHLLAELNEHLHRSQPSHWLPLQQTEQQLGYNSLQYATDLLSDLWYRDQQDGRETRSRHGLILADQTSVELIQQINQAKDDFRAIVNEQKQDKESWPAGYEFLCEQPAPLREKLAVAGLTRIHLKQCFRHIPLLEQAPNKVGFSWYVNGRSIKKLSLQQAQDKLLEFGEHKEHIQIQLAKLGQLSSGTQLAQIQTLAPVVRANLVFGDSQQQTPVQRKSMNLSLPLFIPTDNAHGPLPQHNTIAPEPPAGRTRQARGDNRISDEPYLPTIRAFLYD